MPPAAIRRAIREWCEAEFGKRGLAWYAAVHMPDEGSDPRNIHAHIVYCPRPVQRTLPYVWAFAARKYRAINGTEYPWSTEAPTSRRSRLSALLKHGYRRTGFSHPERDARLKSQLLEVEAFLERVVANRAVSGWKRRTWIKDLRASYARTINDHILVGALQGHAGPRTLDARSYKDAGVQKRPTCHMGQGATYAERAGRITLTGLANRSFEFTWQVRCELIAAEQQAVLIDNACRRADRWYDAANTDWCDRLTIEHRIRVEALKKELRSCVNESLNSKKADATRLRQQARSLSKRSVLRPPQDSAFWAHRRLVYLERLEDQLKRQRKQKKQAGVEIPLGARGLPIDGLLTHIRRLKKLVTAAAARMPSPTRDTALGYYHSALVGFPVSEAENLLQSAEIKQNVGVTRPLAESVLPDGRYIGDFSHGTSGAQLRKLEAALIRFPYELRLAERDTLMADAIFVLNHAFRDPNDTGENKFLRLRRSLSGGSLRRELKKHGVTEDRTAEVAGLCQQYEARSAHSEAAAQSALTDIAVATGIRRGATGIRRVWSTISEKIAGQRPVSQDERSKLRPILEKSKLAYGFGLLVASLDNPNDAPSLVRLTKWADARLKQWDEQILQDPVGRLIAARRGRLAALTQDDRLRRFPDGSPVRHRARVTIEGEWSSRPMEEPETPATRQDMPLLPGNSEGRKPLESPRKPSEPQIFSPSPGPDRTPPKQAVVVQRSQSAKVLKQPRGRGI